MPPIALLTDFGSQDPFVGIMKGVIQRIAPGAALIDLTHEIPPGDILRAAVVLWQAVPYFPPGTIYLGVIDPGVGTARAPILIDSGRGRFIGPDNGLFSFVAAETDPAWELRSEDFSLPESSRTFHGRDIFAPAAGHAARGVKGSEFGPAAGERLWLEPPLLAADSEGNLVGEVLFSDHFGNLLTSLGQFVSEGDGGAVRLRPWPFDRPELPSSGDLLQIEAIEPLVQGGDPLTLVNTFAEIPAGSCAALVGSSGLIELVANRAPAAEMLPLKRHDRIICRTKT